MKSIPEQDRPANKANPLRFSDVARAIGKPPSTLRNWLQRNQVKLPGQHTESPNMTKSKKLRVAHAARAIEKPESTIRTWLQREQVMLPGLSRSGWLDTAARDGWREFTFADIAVLAIVSSLVDFGLRVEAASRVAESLQKKLPKSFGPECNDPLGIITECSDQLAIVQVHDKCCSEIAIMSPEHFAGSWSGSRCIVIYLGDLLEAAFRRAVNNPRVTGPSPLNRS